MVTFVSRDHSPDAGGRYLMVDVALHGHEEIVQVFIMPKGALHGQLGVQVILQCTASV